MKGKMSIKNILATTALVIFVSMFLNMSLAADTIQTANSTESTSSDVTEQATTTEEEVAGGENAQEEENVENKEDENKQEEEAQAPVEENAQEPQQEPQQEQENQDLGKRFVTENFKIKLVPLINATDTVEVQKDQEVYVDKVINGWASIEVSLTNTKGWVRVEKLKTEEQKQADDQAAAQAAEEAAKEAEKNAPVIKKLYVQTEKVHLREQSNSSSNSLGKITKNTEVDVIGEEGEWSKCRINGLIGFISTQYLADKKVEEPTARSSKARTAVTAESQVHDIAASGSASSVVELAKSLVGCKYVYGASGPSSFDCSGLTQYVFGKFGVSLPHNSESQRSCGVEVSRSALQPGDLICYKGHVAIYIGGGQVVHASTPKTGVCIATIDGAKPGAYVCARRVL